MMTSKRIGDELYIYRNGALVMKRWYKHGTNEKRLPSLLFNWEIGWPNESVQVKVEP